ncbi:MAG: hypothetical protein JWM95_4975 [Gemmatimonadetes bacterium]|nr:hypothetical protein [Gemmatimonadota bacterium]
MRTSYLIITFLAAISVRKSMDVVLPVPCAGLCVSDGVPIVVEVLGDGSYLLNRQPVASAVLRSTLEEIMRSRRQKYISMAGHRDASYQSVLTAMDIARSAGVTVISVPPGDLHS